MIKLKRLHAKDTHSMRHAIRNYQHNSGLSEYGYKDYRIRAYGMYDWNVYGTDGTKLNPLSPNNLSFKEAREWLDNYVKEIL